MTTQLNFGRDVQGYNAFAPALSDLNQSASIVSGASSSVTVPGSAQRWIAVLSYQPGSTFWVSVNHTAVPPAGATFASVNSALLPAQLSVKAADTISCYNNTASTQDIGISFYAVP